VRRTWLPVLFLALVPCLAPAQEVEYREPQEEDEDLVQETDYAFNPVQAAKEYKVGGFYWKKKNFRAAAGRYEEAVKWDPGFADAYWRLGQAKEKVAERELDQSKRQRMLDEARSAYEEYLELAPDGNDAKRARKRLTELAKVPAPS